MTFLKLGKNCPICNGISRGRGRSGGDCRSSSNELIHCRTGLELSTIPSGWKFIKLDQYGFGLFAPDNSDWTRAQRLEWQQKVKAERSARQKKEEQALKQSLPIEARDRAIQTLHKYLGLSRTHRQNLRERNLTDTQIDAGYFFTIHPDQELPPGIPANLPGIAWGRLATKTPGIACPAFDVAGNIIGWQLRVDNATDNKYRWAKGKTSSHLPNGELPITVCRPVDGIKIPGVGLVEGLLKPFIAAQKLAQIFIGAAGGHFPPKQLKASLETISKEAQTKAIVTLYPDAGAVTNPHVIGQYQRTIKLITSWGYNSQIAWWGQIDKSHPDIDELTSTEVEAIEYLNPDAFWTIAYEYGGIKEKIQTDGTIDRDEWELKFGLGKWLKSQFKSIQSKVKGFGKSNPKPIQKPPVTPDQTFQNTNQRLQTWQEAVAAGHQYILDQSAPGLGKSHSAGIALPDAFGAEKLWYLSTDHRNPTTGVIETNYVDLPVRHNGLKIDDSRTTPNGNPFLVWGKAGVEPDTKGNCPQTDLFQKFRAKNLNVEASNSSPICNSCKLAFLCQSGSEGKRYGASFRGERRNAMSANRIRAHADSLPSPDGFDYSTSGLFWDEVSSQFKPMESVNVTLSDFDKTWAELEMKNSVLHSSLQPLRLALRPLLSGELKQPLHGWDDASIRALLPEQPDSLSQIISDLETLLTPDLSFLEETPENISSNEAKKLGISRSQVQLANRKFRSKAHNSFSKEFEQLALNWLMPFLKVWHNSTTKLRRETSDFGPVQQPTQEHEYSELRGAFRSERRQLTIFSHSTRHTKIAQNAKFNIFLDATVSRDRLALLLGINPEEVYVVGQETPNLGNLKIIQVTGMGKLGKNRSDSLLQRVAALKTELVTRHPDLVFGDWKAHAETGDGQWFVNLRGSNEFQNATEMAVFGVPYQNVGYLQALYQTITGEYAPLDKENPEPGLQRFIEEQVQAEIDQAIGRMRSHLRPDEQLTFYFVGDYDLSFLDLPIEQVEAFQICPEAGTAIQVTRWKIMEAMRLLQEQGQKITQRKIASVTGISQPMIAQTASQFGGWKQLQKLLLVLLDPLYIQGNHLGALDDEEKWLAQTYLPILLDEPIPIEEAAQNIEQLIQGYGMNAFLRILAASHPQISAQLLALVLQRFPENFSQDIFYETS
jgi:predicted XRE-type DNA-binding protein